MKKLLVASTLVHVAVFAVLARRPSPVVTPAVANEVAVEMEVETASPLVSPVPMPVPVPAPGDLEPSVVARTAGISGAPMVASSAAPASSAGVEPVAGANTDWVVNLGPGVQSTGPFGPGAPQAQQRLGISRQQMEAEERAAQGPRKDSGLKGALLAQDAAKGLGPDGPVLRALESETRSSLAPIRGNATFRAIVDATGTVTGLTILDTSSDRAGWDDARERAFAALQKKKLDMHGTNGALIDIHIESDLRYPSGASGRVELNGPLSLGGDLSDIGSKPARVVHARLSNYTPL